MNMPALALLACHLTEAVLDDFRYADAAAAAAAWSVTPPTPALQMVESEGRTAVQLAAPFRDQPELQRVYADRRVDLDLSAAGGFVLEAETEPPEALARVSLYFHSRDGWYSAGGRATKPGWQRLRFTKSAFGTEESAAGWDKFDGIRIAFLRGSEPGNVNAVIRLRRLAAIQQDLALVVPGAAGILEHHHRQARCPQCSGHRFVVRRGRPADQLAGHAVERPRRVFQPCFSDRRLRPEDAVGGVGPGPSGRTALATDCRHIAAACAKRGALR